VNCWNSLSRWVSAPNKESRHHASGYGSSVSQERSPWIVEPFDAVKHVRAGLVPGAYSLRSRRLRLIVEKKLPIAAAFVGWAPCFASGAHDATQGASNERCAACRSAHLVAQIPRHTHRPVGAIPLGEARAHRRHQSHILKTAPARRASYKDLTIALT